MTHLLLTIHWLDDRYHGLLDREGPPEWPPSPFRLFQALVAGVARRGELESELGESLAWLQTHDPPMIVSPRSHAGHVVTRFVPINDGDKKPDRQSRLTGKTFRPTLMLDPPEIHYFWPIDDVGIPQARLVCQAAHYLTCLGWGIDMAYADGRLIDLDEITQLSGECWYPSKVVVPGGVSLRVPYVDNETKENTLSDLKRAHQSALDRIQRNEPLNNVDMPKIFDIIFYQKVTIPPPRPYAVFEVKDLNDKYVLAPPENTICVAAMLRSLACREENRRDFQEQFDEDSEVYLAGHANGEKHTPPRFSYLPLPTIGYQHADGMIRRLLIAEPYGDNGLHARWAQQRLRNQVLRDNDGNERGVLLDLWRTSSGAMVNRYVGESQNWATVTPVLLPGYDDGKRAKADKLFLQAVAQAGLTVESIEEFTLRKAPFYPGAQHPRLYQRPKYLIHSPGGHVWIRFREPISGPLAIGAGRHCGLGIFAGFQK